MSLPIHVAKQRPATTDYHSPIADISREFWWRILQRLTDHSYD